MPRACCDKFHTWLLWWCGGHNQMMVVGECFLSYFWESYGWRDDEGPSHVTDSPIDRDVRPVMSYQNDPGPDFSAPIPRTAIFTMLQIYHHCSFFQSFLCAIFLSPTVKKINSLHNLSNDCSPLCFLVESRNCGIKFGLSATTCTVCCEFYNGV